MIVLFPLHIFVNFMKYEFWFKIIINLSLFHYTFSKFLEDTYGYDRTKAAYINGILYETSILICPVVGQVNVSIHNKTTTSSRNFIMRCLVQNMSRSKAVLLLWIFHVFSVLCLLCLCARLFICALWSPAGKGLTSWLSFVVSICESVTFPLIVSIPDLCTLTYFSWDILVHAVCFSLICTCAAHMLIFLCVQHHKGIWKLLYRLNIVYINVYIRFV